MGWATSTFSRSAYGDVDMSKRDRWSAIQVIPRRHQQSKARWLFSSSSKLSFKEHLLFKTFNQFGTPGFRSRPLLRIILYFKHASSGYIEAQVPTNGRRKTSATCFGLCVPLGTGTGPVNYEHLIFHGRIAMLPEVDKQRCLAITGLGLAGTVQTGVAGISLHRTVRSEQPAATLTQWGIMKAWQTSTSLG
jgi:hypothetical protein